jgi:uroporphyrinogen III methyltransferase/synthase
MIGFAWLAGAGPGDPDLVTVGTVRRLREADVVVFDRLIPAGLLEEAREGAELIDAGKRSGQHTLGQDEINAILVDRVKRGLKVVRLKGGDPFVFGRGGEEAAALAAAGLPFGVIPGVSSAVAGPAYAGIPVTHRGVAVSFAVVTGHEDQTRAETAVDWEGVASGADTLVILMGVETLPETAAALLSAGRAASTPAAVIERATGPEQRTVTASLSDIAAAARAAGIESPAVIVVGDVVALRDHLAWFDRRPLFGKRVLVTRARAQASKLVALLREEGAEPVEFPALEIAQRVDPVTDPALERLAGSGYGWMVFTSVNGVEAFFARMDEHGFPASVFARTKVAAIGPATAAALAGRGVKVDVVPPDYVAEALVAELLSAQIGGTSVLVARAAGARAELVDGLRGGGASVDELLLYEARAPATADAAVIERIRGGEIDIVTLASSSTARGLKTLLGGNLAGMEQAVVACIGPITAATARELGFDVAVEAEEHTIEGLVAALKRYVQWAREESLRSTTRP